MCGADFPLKVSALGDSCAARLRRRSCGRRARFPTAHRCRRAGRGASRAGADAPHYAAGRNAAAPAGRAAVRGRRIRRPARRATARSGPPYPPRYIAAGRADAFRARPADLPTPPGVADPDNDAPLPDRSAVRPDGMPDTHPGQPRYRTREAEPSPPRRAREPPPFRSGPPRAPPVTGGRTGRGEAGGDARLPDRVGARPLDRRRGAARGACAGSASRWSRSSRSPPIPAAA